ncbi:A/G-specific adenine glycosylase [Burkholderiaceae bacterium DAT-1]|nr:A/G-specific adenine glycosylase [Burkholderiaceae bacterium DAT-1]
MSDSFASRLIRWQKVHGRHDLPWQTDDPYRVWLSEIMLQQTQVTTVIPYYLRFVERFPDVAALAEASQDDVLALWSGLGYYSRARNLHRAAQMVMSDFGGCFPDQSAQLIQLPGIGPSTAAAVAAFSSGERVTILDGNVKRVLARWRAIEGFPGEKRIEQQLWALAETLVPEVNASIRSDMKAYTQGLMDLGATLCTRSRPNCSTCPLRSDCVAYQSARTHELPTPRPKKAVPERYAVFVLLRHGGKVLLEKRAENGIWGGMWSLPQCEPDDLAAWLASAFGAVERDLRPLARLTHIFTHFKLHIDARMLNASIPFPAASEVFCWVTIADALNMGIPLPVRKLLLAAQSPLASTFADGINGEGNDGE